MPLTAPSIISVKKVSFSYDKGEPTLKNINLEENEGEFMGLIGPNGGGKSTLLKLMLGILPVQEGEIKLFGEDIKNVKNRSIIGYVSQNAAYFDHRFPATVSEVVAMGSVASKGLLSALTKEDSEMATQALKDVDMLRYKDVPLHHLSGGQQQRVFIARALTSRPRLLVLDEPTIGIDLHAQEQFYTLLKTLRNQKNLTIILVSHDIDVVAAEATTFACLNQTLIYHGIPQDFIKDDYLKKLYAHDMRHILHGH